MTDEQYSCVPELSHELLSHPVCRSLLTEVVQRALPERGDSNCYRDIRFSEAMRLARAALYMGDPSGAAAQLQAEKQRWPTDALAAFYAQLFNAWSPSAVLELMSPELRAQYVSHMLARSVERFRVPSASMLTAAARVQSPALAPLAVTFAAIRGYTEHVEVWLGDDVSASALEARAVLAMQRGAFEQARALSVQAWNAPRVKRKPKLENPLAALLTLLLAKGSAEHVAIAREQLARVTQRSRVDASYHGVAKLLDHPFEGTRQAPIGHLAAHLE